MEREPIVVTGYGSVTPLGVGAETTWRHLMDGRSAGQILEQGPWEKLGHPTLATVPQFSVPDVVSNRDRSLQLGLVAAQEAWDKAGLNQVPQNRIGSTFSSSKGGLLSLLEAQERPHSDDFLNDFFPHSAGQLLKQYLGFCGPTLSVASACSTGLGSLAMAVELLDQGLCDAVLAGSTESAIHPLVYAAFSNMGVLTERKRGPAPFDEDRDGFRMGEGSGVLILERESSALARRAPIHARLSACALGADGTDFLEIEPRGSTIRSVIERSLDRAGLSPMDIGYINAHGTGTRLNDRVESKALFEVFGDSGAWVSSTKGATGHLLGAAGSVEAVLALMALLEGRLPETRNLLKPDPECRIRHVSQGGVEQRIDHVLSLSYGFGGQLGAVIFSKYP